MKQLEKNKEQIHKWLDNFHNNIDNYLDDNQKYNIKDILKLMPEEVGREYVRLGDEAFGLGNKLPDYDQIMNRKEEKI
tara:strand:+ start:157 stop:390 length:234 start_codon:yes stop_codon:yes gene_type:complete